MRSAILFFELVLLCLSRRASASGEQTVLDLQNNLPQHNGADDRSEIRFRTIETDLDGNVGDVARVWAQTHTWIQAAIANEIARLQESIGDLLQLANISGGCKRALLSTLIASDNLQSWAVKCEFLFFNIFAVFCTACKSN